MNATLLGPAQLSSTQLNSSWLSLTWFNSAQLNLVLGSTQLNSTQLNWAARLRFSTSLGAPNQLAAIGDRRMRITLRSNGSGLLRTKDRPDQASCESDSTFCTTHPHQPTITDRRSQPQTINHKPHTTNHNHKPRITHHTSQITHHTPQTTSSPLPDSPP